MESKVARSWFVETAPLQMIKVEKARRASTFATILEDCVQECMNLVPYGAVKPAAVIEHKKPCYVSTLETIWEETMQYVEGFVCEASWDVTLRGGPVLRLNYWDQFCMCFEDDGQVGSWGTAGV